MLYVYTFYFTINAGITSLSLVETIEYCEDFVSLVRNWAYAIIALRSANHITSTSSLDEHLLSKYTDTKGASAKTTEEHSQFNDQLVSIKAKVNVVKGHNNSKA
jgi:hypothetical protein